MIQFCNSQPRGLWLFFSLALLSFGILAACGTTDGPGTPAPAALTRRELDATKVASIEGSMHAWETRVASGTPFMSTPLPMATPKPVVTPIMGLHTCGDGNTVFEEKSCWTGYS